MANLASPLKVDSADWLLIQNVLIVGLRVDNPLVMSILKPWLAIFMWDAILEISTCFSVISRDH